jgi:hypothetical protein
MLIWREANSARAGPRDRELATGEISLGSIRPDISPSRAISLVRTESAFEGEFRKWGLGGDGFSSKKVSSS